jgi:hypothetical protein
VEGRDAQEDDELEQNVEGKWQDPFSPICSGSRTHAQTVSSLPVVELPTAKMQT